MPADPPPVSLAGLADEVRKLAARFQHLKKVGSAVDDLHVQAEELRKLADRARPLAVARGLIAAEGPIPGLPVERLTEARDRVATAAEQFRADAVAGPQPPLEFPPLRRALDSAEAALKAAWAALATAPIEGEAMLPILEHHPSFWDAIRRSRAARVELHKLAASLPTTAHAVERVKMYRATLQDALGSLEAQGFDAESLDFLRRCPAGYPLADLLDRPDLIKWLRAQEKMLASLTVRSS
jgi:hypothetical protein